MVFTHVFRRHVFLPRFLQDLIDPFLVEALWQVCGLGWFLRKLTIDGEVGIASRKTCGALVGVVVGWLAGWLVGWLAGWLVVCLLVGLLFVCLFVCLFDCWFVCLFVCWFVAFWWGWVVVVVVVLVVIAVGLCGCGCCWLWWMWLWLSGNLFVNGECFLHHCQPRRCSS